MLRIRPWVAAASITVVATGLPALPASALADCDPTDTFCVDYTATVLSAETNQPTTQSLEPAALTLDFTNTSANYRNETGQPRWLKSLSATLASSGTIRPVVTPSSQLPDGLLLAGNPDSSMCAGGTDNTFATCTAGHGIAYAKVTTSGFPALVLPSGIYTATYGIKQVKNVAATTDLARYEVTLGVCLQNGSSTCVMGEQEQRQVISIAHPAAGQPLSLTFTMPTAIPVQSGVTVDRFTLHTLDLSLKGIATKLANGTSLASPRTVIALPEVCGPVNVGATLTSVSNKVVSLNQAMTITGCTVLTSTLSPSKVKYPGTATVAGTLKTDAGSAVPNRQLAVKRCDAVLECVTANVTTNSLGAYSHSWNPIRNTTVTVTDAVSNRVVTRTQLVSPYISLGLSSSTMHSGGQITLKGTVYPGHAGSAVAIQRKINGVWTTIATTGLSSTSSYSRTLTLSGAYGSTTYLRVYLRAHADHAAAYSPNRTVKFN